MTSAELCGAVIGMTILSPAFSVFGIGAVLVMNGGRRSLTMARSSHFRASPRCLAAKPWSVSLAATTFSVKTW